MGRRTKTRMHSNGFTYARTPLGSCPGRSRKKGYEAVGVLPGLMPVD